MRRFVRSRCGETGDHGAAFCAITMGRRTHLWRFSRAVVIVVAAVTGLIAASKELAITQNVTIINAPRTEVRGDTVYGVWGDGVVKAIPRNGVVEGRQFVEVRQGVWREATSGLGGMYYIGGNQKEYSTSALRDIVAALPPAEPDGDVGRDSPTASAVPSIAQGSAATSAMQREARNPRWQVSVGYEKLKVDPPINTVESVIRTQLIPALGSCYLANSQSRPNSERPRSGPRFVGKSLAVDPPDWPEAFDISCTLTISADGDVVEVQPVGQGYPELASPAGFWYGAGHAAVACLDSVGVGLKFAATRRSGAAISMLLNFRRWAPDAPDLPPALPLTFGPVGTPVEFGSKSQLQH